MTSIKIPNTITRIYYGAFSDCTNLKDVYYSGTEEEWKKVNIAVFNDPLSSATIHFNSEHKEPVSEPTTQPTTEPTENKLVGDINGDGKIDSKDAVLVLKSYAESLVSGNKSTDLAGDINNDGSVDSKDAVIILKYYAATLTGFSGSITEFK